MILYSGLLLEQSCIVTQQVEIFDITFTSFNRENNGWNICDQLLSLTRLSKDTEKQSTRNDQMTSNLATSTKCLSEWCDDAVNRLTAQIESSNNVREI